MSRRAPRVVPLGDGEREAWDSLAAARPDAGFMQSWAWSRFKELEGYAAIRLGLVEGTRLVGGGIAYVYPSPAEGALAVFPDGPLLDWTGSAAPETLRALVTAVATSPAGRSVVAVRVAPRLTAEPPVLADLPRAPVDLVPDETLLSELGPEPAMRARMRPKGRYNAGLAARRGVEVVSSTDPGAVHELYFVLGETARYQDFLLEPKSFFINLARSLFPEHGRLAFARYKGITLAAALTVRHGGTVTYLYGGHLPLFPEVMASYALHWHVMREAARDGYRVYDWYGWVRPGSPEHPYDRFSRFKEKLGGAPVRRIGARDVLLHDRLVEAALAAIRPPPVLAGRSATPPADVPGGRRP